MLFFQNLSVLSLFLICLIFVFTTPFFLSQTKFSIVKLLSLVIANKILISSVFTSSNWKPLFKRSSYIGLVWKSQWKL